MRIALSAAFLLAALIAWDIPSLYNTHLSLYLLAIGAAALWLHPVSCAVLLRVPRVSALVHAAPSVLLGAGHLFMRELHAVDILFHALYIILLMLLYELQEWHARLLGIPGSPETRKAARALAARLLVRYSLLVIVSWAVIALGLLMVMRLTETWSALALAIAALLIIVGAVRAAYCASSSGGPSSTDRYCGGISSTR